MDRVVKPHQTVAHEEEDRSRGELLRHGTCLEDGVRRDWDNVFERRQAVSAKQHRGSVAAQADGTAGGVARELRKDAINIIGSVSWDARGRRSRRHCAGHCFASAASVGESKDEEDSGETGWTHGGDGRYCQPME
jgi:hypothetical protein